MFMGDQLKSSLYNIEIFVVSASSSIQPIATTIFVAWTKNLVSVVD